MVLDPEALLALPAFETRRRYDQRDTILYALGVGAGQEPDRAGLELRFTYEDGLLALPTLATVLAPPGPWLRDPQYNIDWRKNVHGEHSVEIHAELPVAGEARSVLKPTVVVDKGADKGAVIYWTREVYDEGSGLHIATNRLSTFCRGDGGCGSLGVATWPDRKIPDVAPDCEISLTTRNEQALLYRLSGDPNPIHADPVAARKAGFDGPILHGLCTFGFAGRAILLGLCKGEPGRLKTLEGRFSAPVYPGETISTRLWLLGPERAAFRCVVPERDITVIDKGWASFA